MTSSSSIIRRHGRTVLARTAAGVMAAGLLFGAAAAPAQAGSVPSGQKATTQQAEQSAPAVSVDRVGQYDFKLSLSGFQGASQIEVWVVESIGYSSDFPLQTWLRPAVLRGDTTSAVVNYEPYFWGDRAFEFHVVASYPDRPGVTVTVPIPW